MKKIRELKDPTPGLAEYLDLVGNNANWAEFRSHMSGASYEELRESLTRNQHGLCAYCEIEINGWRRQVEHVVPRSDGTSGKAKTFDMDNLIACCLGGTAPVTGSRRGGRKPGRLSCGQAKGNQWDPHILNPREIPDLPSLMRVIDNGVIEADETACEVAGFLPELVTRTIEILNLNSERLRLAREKRWDGLQEELGQVYDASDPEVVNDWMRSELTPDEAGCLVQFFTTSRSYFAPLSEDILAEDPQEWV